MNHIARYFLISSLLFLLSACSGMPKLFWDTQEGQNDGPVYAKGAASYDGAGDKPRAPLEVPPELRAELEIPETDQVEMAPNSVPVPVQYRKAVAGKAVSLEARQYNIESMNLFSAAADAMTALSMPVNSVDSPSGILTTDWIRKQVGTNSMLNLESLLGGAGKPKAYRHRFVLRIFKTDGDIAPQSRLEVRMISQVFLNNHWVNKQFSNKPRAELFAAVENQLALMQQTPASERSPE
ncbi:hypothetical protein MMIC_P1028 [Mariprofundus micogutta]|uniref:Uncharacterized protein n=1 Tax=Mariprofundus micogutta TaxID=1921010 RepID=A0A1L8CMD4_9PROT|nr:hypothetical protein [Mariprofundus micogutta]GAV20066.1 hypothetical protein MMIC_P1028 [Mariprofundus micogutta]